MSRPGHLTVLSRPNWLETATIHLLTYVFLRFDVRRHGQEPRPPLWTKYKNWKSCCCFIRTVFNNHLYIPPMKNNGVAKGRSSKGSDPSFVKKTSKTKKKYFSTLVRLTSVARSLCCGGLYQTKFYHCDLKTSTAYSLQQFTLNESWHRPRCMHNIRRSLHITVYEFRSNKTLFKC